MPGLTVWPAAQREAPKFTRVWTAELAEQIINEFTPDGDLVIDPFCAETTLIEAAHSRGRRAIGVHADTVRPSSAHRRRSPTSTKSRPGGLELRRGDARSLIDVLADIRGQGDLMAAAPPRSLTGNAEKYREAMTQVIAGCWQLLKPGGLLVTLTTNSLTLDPVTGAPHLTELASQTVALARELGFGYLQHLVALRVPIHGDTLVLQPAHAERPVVAHADVLVLGKPPGRPTTAGTRDTLAGDR